MEYLWDDEQDQRLVGEIHKHRMMAVAPMKTLMVRDHCTSTRRPTLSTCLLGQAAEIWMRHLGSHEQFPWYEVLQVLLVYVSDKCSPFLQVLKLVGTLIGGRGQSTPEWLSADEDARRRCSTKRRHFM